MTEKETDSIRKLIFTDIYGVEHSRNLKTWVDKTVQVPKGFSHYMTTNGSINIVGKTTFTNIGDIFINDETGEVKTILSKGSVGYILIGNLVKECSGLIKVDTKLGGNLTIQEVINEEATTYI